MHASAARTGTTSWAIWATSIFTAYHFSRQSLILRDELPFRSLNFPAEQVIAWLLT